MLQPIQDIIEQCATDWKINSVWIYWWFFQRKLNWFKNEFYQTYLKKVETQVAYSQTTNTKLISDYLLIKRNKDHPMINIKKETNYLYRRMTSKQSKNCQLLDSQPEATYMGKINEIIKSAINDRENWIKDLVWAKNPVNSEVYLEHVENNKIHKIFPDFIYKIKNYYIYVEVKAMQDINPEKTATIRDIYRKYLKNPQNNQIVFRLVQIADRYSQPKTENFSNINEIKPEYTLSKVLNILNKLQH